MKQVRQETNHFERKKDLGCKGKILREILIFKKNTENNYEVFNGCPYKNLEKMFVSEHAKHKEKTCLLKPGGGGGRVCS